jgi:hypothetical protein
LGTEKDGKKKNNESKRTKNAKRRAGPSRANPHPSIGSKYSIMIKKGRKNGLQPQTGKREKKKKIKKK